MHEGRINHGKKEPTLFRTAGRESHREIQFTKAPYVLEGMGVEKVKKTTEAIEELREKGMTPGDWEA